MSDKGDFQRVQLDEDPSRDDNYAHLELGKDAKLMRIFNLPLSEKVVTHYHCTHGVHDGNMYITFSHLVFYSKIPKEVITIYLDDIERVEKRKTAKVLPNAMKIVDKRGQDLTLSAFLHRDDALSAIERQRTAWGDFKKRKSEDDKFTNALKTDKAMKDFHLFEKINATELQDSLMVPDPNQRRCCIIV